tara:strand:- start:447 stop:1466 length:1020 start_codon:yes stop_codon:yes gene_type:complete
MEKANWGIIGLGNIAREFANGFAEAENACIKGIASNNLNRLSEFKNKFNINENYCFSNYQELIECEEIDIIYITLPHSLHYEWIIKSLNNEKNTIVEKPATINFEQISNIKKKFYSKNFFFAEAFMYRYHPQIKKLIQLIKEKKIGNLINMESYFGVNIMEKKTLFGIKRKKKINEKSRLFDKRLGGGAILDLGCYPSSMSLLIASLKSDFTDVIIKDKNVELFKTGVDINSYAKLVFDNEFMSFIGTSFNKDLGKRTKIKGDIGEIIIEDSWDGNNSKIFINSQNNEIINIKAKSNIYSYEIEIFSKNFLENNYEIKYPGMKFKETYLNMKILDNWLN